MPFASKVGKSATRADWLTDCRHSQKSFVTVCPATSPLLIIARNILLVQFRAEIAPHIPHPRDRQTLRLSPARSSSESSVHQRDRTKEFTAKNPIRQWDALMPAKKLGAPQFQLNIRTLGQLMLPDSNYRSISTSNPGAPRAASTAMHQVVLAFGRFSEFDKFANVSFRTTGSNVNTGAASSFFGTIAFPGFGDLTQSAKSLTAPEPVLSDFTINHLNRNNLITPRT
jgi:hypothetical protein